MMQYLLDTQVALWWLTANPAISKAQRRFFGDATNSFIVSSVSVWEIAIKSSLGKLEADIAGIRAAVDDAGLERIDFGFDDATEVRNLAPLHRDPFDRALLAQARCRGLRLLTADARLISYGAPVLRFDAIA